MLIPTQETKTSVPKKNNQTLQNSAFWVIQRQQIWSWKENWWLNMVEYSKFKSNAPDYFLEYIEFPKFLLFGIFYP